MQLNAVTQLFDHAKDTDGEREIEISWSEMDGMSIVECEMIGDDVAQYKDINGNYYRAKSFQVLKEVYYEPDYDNPDRVIDQDFVTCRQAKLYFVKNFGIKPGE